MSGGLRHQTVAAEVQLVSEVSGSAISQPSGRPISAATNAGLRTIPLLPPVVVVGSWGKAVACDLRVGDPARSLVRIGSLPLAASDARGVPHILAAAASVKEGGTVEFDGPVDSCVAALRAGHIFAWTVSDVAVLRSVVGHIRTARSVSVVPCVPVVFGFPPDERLSIPVAVGHKPEPLASMRGTNVGRAAQTPFRIEPEAGKVSEDMG